MSCFVIGFPLLGTREYPQTPFAVAKISSYWVQQNTHAQTIASILTMVISHHERWKTKHSHKEVKLNII
jgi:GDP-D-mannose dehydratase